MPFKVNAQRGCCSHHDGIAGCHSSGKQLCNDGTLSPSCICTSVEKTIYGCTDKIATNYNSLANIDDGSCEYKTNVEEDKRFDAIVNDEDDSGSSIIGFLVIVCVAAYGIYYFKKNRK